MKVIRFDTESRVAHVQLTRRNLAVLMAKLDDENSERTIIKDDGFGIVVVTAVEDDEHYSERTFGPMLVNGKEV